MPSRRDILAGLAVVTVALAVAPGRELLTAFGTKRLAHRLAAVLSNVASAAALGAAYLSRFPAENGTAVLVNLVLGPDFDRRSPSPLELKARVLENRQRDFEDGRTVELSGWLISLTEARVCALVALLDGANASQPTFR